MLLKRDSGYKSALETEVLHKLKLLLLIITVIIPYPCKAYKRDEYYVTHFTDEKIEMPNG